MQLSSIPMWAAILRQCPKYADLPLRIHIPWDIYLQTLLTRPWSKQRRWQPSPKGSPDTFRHSSSYKQKSSRRPSAIPSKPGKLKRKEEVCRMQLSIFSRCQKSPVATSLPEEGCPTDPFWTNLDRRDQDGGTFGPPWWSKKAILSPP